MKATIHTVLIWTEDVRRLASFYTDKLALEIEQEGEEFAIFKPPSPGATQFGLGKHSEVKGQTKEPDRIMVNFGVDDCKAEYQRLKDRGVEFTREPSIDPQDGFMIATFHDPDGNTLQLFQPPS
jgi:predicted enzyme related to lactoylglutathione lyase